MSKKRIRVYMGCGGSKEGRSLGQALREAATNGEAGKVASLLTLGAPVDAANDWGSTALTWAAEYGHVDVGKTLLAHAANVNKKASNGFTALHEACRHGRATMARLLLAAGADPEATNDWGKTPMDSARILKNNEWEECVAICEQWKGLSTAQRESKKAEWWPEGPEGRRKAREEVEWKAREEAMADVGHPLREAAENGDSGRVASLLAQGAHVDAPDPDYGRTALMQVADKGHVDVATTLLAHGANVNYKQLGGQTALHVACAWGRAAMTRLLLAAGADPEAKTNLDMTSMDTARECKRNDWKECLVILEEHSFQSFQENVRKAREDTERKAREATERQREAREEVERRAREEAERRAREETEWKAMPMEEADEVEDDESQTEAKCQGLGGGEKGEGGGTDV